MAVSCGGEAWGDPDHIARIVRRYTDALDRLINLPRWSVEAIGIFGELNRRFQILKDAMVRFASSDWTAIQLGYDAACGRYERLEEEFFERSNHSEDAIAVSLEGGWLGSTNDETPNVIGDVRQTLLDIYIEIRARDWINREEDLTFAREVVARVNNACDNLFSITGPDEFLWRDWIITLSDAARDIKDDAFWRID